MAKTNLRAIKEWASSYSLQKVTPFCFIFQCTSMTSCFLSLIAYTMWSNSWVIKFCLEWPPTSLDFWIFIVQYSSCSLNTHHPMSMFCFVVQHLWLSPSFKVLSYYDVQLTSKSKPSNFIHVEVMFYHNLLQCSNLLPQTLEFALQSPNLS